MPAPRTLPPAARLRHHLAALAGPDPTDAELLARFVATRDNDAFSGLVRRHGPAVLAVCRRVTGNRTDADDAFQATFLVLARKADRVRPAAAVGGWLYGVAVRAARKAVARTCRRRDRETPVGTLPDVPQPCPPAHDPDVVRVVLEEVARLSPAHRAAVVLCALEGRSRASAAQILGVPEGTLSSRLALARKALAARLRDRGLAPAVLAAVAGAAGCPVLAADAARLAGISDRYPPRVELLTEAVMRQTFGAKWVWLPVLAAVAAVGLVLTAAEPPRAGPPPVVKPAADPAPGGRLLLMKEDGFSVVTPGGKELGVVGQQGELPGFGWLSPDGKQVAYATQIRQKEGDGRRCQVVLRDAAGGAFMTTIDVQAYQLCWSPTGTELYATWFLDEEGVIRATHYRIDLTARTVGKHDWPDNVRPLEWARDGKSLLVFGFGAARKPILALMSPDGKTVTDLTGLHDTDPVMFDARMSPDGRRVLFSDIPPGVEGNEWGMTRRLYVFDRTTKKRTEVAEVPENATVFWCCWSPDGRKIAYTWRQRHAELAKKKTLSGGDVTVETEMFLIVADADGRNAQTIASVKTDNAMELPFQGIDWR